VTRAHVSRQVAAALFDAGASAAGLAWQFCIGAIVIISLIGLQLFLALVVNALTNAQVIVPARHHDRGDSNSSARTHARPVSWDSWVPATFWKICI
jgi:hypothetical protein